MPRYRTSSAVGIAVGLVAAACGGGEDIAENENDSHPVWFDSPPAAVQIGDRFEWCADLGQGWAEFDAGWAAAQTAERELWAAMDAVESASDDLDLAEARQAREVAIERLSVVRGAYWDEVLDAEEEVLNAYRVATGQKHTDDETFAVASKRAWEAFLKHSPETREAAVEVSGSESDEHHPLRASINAAVQIPGDAYDAFRESFSESCA